MNLLFIVLILAGFDFGGRIAAVYPVGGFGRFHSSSALVGGNIGYSTGPVRLESGYGYTSLPGHQVSPYLLSFHQLSLSSGYDFAHWADWGFEATAGLGYLFARRDYGRAREKGKAGSGELGVYFFQHTGKSRLSVGLAHTLVFERDGTSGIAINQFFQIRAGVAYVP